MDLVGQATERTTAATDALLAVAALAVVVALRRRTPASFGRSVWLAALVCMVLASAIGAAAHGLALSDGVRELLWQPLYLALGVTMALFVVGAARDWRGDRAGRRLLPPMLFAALAFYGITRATGGDFLAFVLFEAVALGFALGVYAWLAARQGRPGAAAMAAALAVSLAAGAVQAADVGTVRLLWDFDHNGLFHLVQLAGLALLAAGLRRSLRHPAPEAS
ncbi:MAG: DUF6962 family protein [Gemmatimonadales bacterium]